MTTGALCFSIHFWRRREREHFPLIFGTQILLFICLDQFQSYALHTSIIVDEDMLDADPSESEFLNHHWPVSYHD